MPAGELGYGDRKMSAGMVRWGGIAVFIGIALAVIFPFIMMAVVGMQAMQAGMGSATAGAKIMSIVMNFAMMAVMVYAFLATKGYFNALSYHRADIPIYIIIGVQAVWVVLGLIVNVSGGMAGLMQGGDMRALGIVGIIALVTVLVFFVALLIFAIFCIRFGTLGGGLWKAIGILYVIALIGIFISILVIGIAAAIAGGGGGSPPGGAVVGAVLIVLALLCYAAAIICHGIGLVTGAGRMERMHNPADAF